MTHVIRIATRPSKLAIIQANLAKVRLQQHGVDAAISILPINSDGDIESREPIREFGDKAVFVTRIEQAVAEGRADVAVHSLKDLPVEMPPGLWLAGFLPREDPRDVLISASQAPLDQLPSGSRVGTSSVRRVEQLRTIRSDLNFIDIRGNVDTRLRKLGAGDYDAIVLAAAGLLRLGLADAITEYLEPSRCIPAPGQGIIVLECRENSEFGEELLQINSDTASLAAKVERSLARHLGVTCMTPFGALATVKGKQIQLQACLVKGSELRRVTLQGPLDDGLALAREAADRLRPGA